MQEFNSMKIGLYVAVFNALPNKEKFHILGDQIIGDNKVITITPNTEPGMAGRVDITLTCDLTNVRVVETEMFYMQAPESKLTVHSLLCKYRDALVTASQNVLSHLRTMFDTVFVREEGSARDEWYIDNSSKVTIELSTDMSFVNFTVTRKDERLITTEQKICTPLYRITPNTVVENVIPIIQELVKI